MQIEPLSVIPPKMERPATTGAAVSASVETNLLSNNPEIPVQPVAELETTSPARGNRSETVWLESECRSVIRLLNERTGEIVSQMPSDEVLRVSRNIEDLMEKDSPKKLDLET
jgi:hypothetical protein